MLDGNDLWIVTEERRSADRPAQLLRFDFRSGHLLQALPLPVPWRAAPGQGLAANQGPESLTSLPGSPLTLLLAAERPLLQDPPDQLRLLEHGPGGFRPVGSLRLLLPAPHWGLTELLAPTSGGLLGLVRGFEPPASWWAQLLQLSPPGPEGSLQEPLARWDLLAAGLPPRQLGGTGPGGSPSRWSSHPASGERRQLQSAAGQPPGPPRPAPAGRLQQQQQQQRFSRGSRGWESGQVRPPVPGP